MAESIHSMGVGIGAQQCVHEVDVPATGSHLFGSHPRFVRRRNPFLTRACTWAECVCEKSRGQMSNVRAASFS